MSDLPAETEQGPAPELSPSCAVNGSAYRHEDGTVVCASCGCECDWEPCYAGCEDGYFDGYEEDPLWYDVGDLIPCNECRLGMDWQGKVFLCY